MPARNRLRRRQIRRGRQHRRTGFLLDPLRRGLDSLTIPRGDGDLCAVGGERTRHGKAESFARAADHRDFPLEVQIQRMLLSRSRLKADREWYTN